MARKPAFISHSPRREAEIQNRMLDVLEARFRRHFAAAIIEESEAIVAGYRELGYPPPVSDDAVARFREVYRSLALASARTFGSRIVSQGKALGYDMETKQIDFAAFFATLANRWINLESIRRRITSVAETTRERIITQVARGQEEGLGVAAIAKNISEDARTISRVRAAVIARTETHGAANYAAQEAAVATGLNLRKEWISSEDGRTRPDHDRANGQIVAMDEPFIVGGDRLMYPGDSRGSAEQTINCRCAVAHIVDDDFDD